MEYNIIKIQEKLKELQQPKRYQHTLGVQYTSAALAMCYGCDIKKAELAGLLHDCAKYMSDEDIFSKCKKHNIQITDVQERNPFLLHAKLGAYYAYKKYDISDQEILDSITYHTTGRPEMTLLDKIVFIADYIEPSRKEIQDLDEIRKLAFCDIDKAMYLSLYRILQYLKADKSSEVDNMTYETFMYFDQLLKGK